MKPPQPSFAIVTPSYNQAQFLDQTITSILSQPELTTYLVRDGGSTDASVELLKKQKSPKLHWVSKKDKGQADAINQGLTELLKNPKLSDDTICAYLNSDDYYTEGAFAAVAEAFAQQPHKQWLVGDALIVNQNNEPIQKLVRLYKQIGRAVLTFWLLGIVNPLPQPAVFFKLGAVRQIGLLNPDLHLVLDYEYWLRLYQQCGSPIVTNTTLAAFRIHQGSKGTQQFTTQFAEQYRVAQRFFKNPLVLWLQSVHNLLIIWIYTLIK